MRKKIHVAVIFNEPTIETESGRKYISEDGRIEAMATRTQVLAGASPTWVDLSEVGVLEEREHVARALMASGYRASLFNMNSNVKRLFQFIEEKEPDLIFNLCESVGNESIHEMHVAGLYELLKIPYTGASASALGTCQNKARAKEILTYHKIPTPRFRVYKNIGEFNGDELELKFPLIVKPGFEDASVGVDIAAVVQDAAALKKRIRYIFQNYDQPAIVEEYVEGREINIALMGNKRPITLPISEIDFSGLPADYPKIVTYNAKWMQGTEEFTGTVGMCPAQLPPDVEKLAKEIALKAYRVMGCRDYARVDIRLDKNYKPFVIEVNPNPDISDDAGFARSATAYGLTFQETITRIVEYALERTP